MISRYWRHILHYMSKSVFHCVTLAHHLINYMATHLSQAPFARIEISIFRACQLAQSYYKSTIKTSKKLLIWADKNGLFFWQISIKWKAEILNNIKAISCTKFEWSPLSTKKLLNVYWFRFVFWFELRILAASGSHSDLVSTQNGL